MIDGGAIAAGAREPFNPCRSCDPSSSSTAWTALADDLDAGDGRSCWKGVEVCRAAVVTASSPRCVDASGNLASCPSGLGEEGDYAASRTNADFDFPRFTSSGSKVTDGNTQLQWDDALSPAVAHAPASTACGGSGARLPEVRELAALLDYGSRDAGANGAFPPGISGYAGNVWAAETVGSPSAAVLFVGAAGFAFEHDAGDTERYLCVTGATATCNPATRFEANGSALVDHDTGLTWAEPPAFSADGGWTQMLATCNALPGFHAASLKEIYSIVTFDGGATNGILPAPLQATHRRWTSSPDPHLAGQALFIELDSLPPFSGNDAIGTSHAAPFCVKPQ